MHKADEVAPGVPMLDGSDGTLGALAENCGQCPDLAQDGLEPNAVFIDGPYLDGCMRKGGRDRAQERAQMLLELRLGLHVGLHMTRPRLQPTSAESAQGAPALLTTDVASEALAQPGGHRPSAPPVARGMGAGHSCSQLRQLGGCQIGPSCTLSVAPVAHAVGAVGVVALGDLANPVR